MRQICHWLHCFVLGDIGRDFEVEVCAISFILYHIRVWIEAANFWQRATPRFFIHCKQLQQFAYRKIILEHIPSLLRFWNSFLNVLLLLFYRPSLPASTAGFEFMFNFINTYNVCSLGYFMLNKNKPNYIPLPANSGRTIEQMLRGTVVFFKSGSID